MTPELAYDLTNELRVYMIEVEALVVGCDGDKLAHIYQVDAQGMVTCHDDINFAAIGIGSNHTKSHFMFSRYPRLLNYFHALPIIYGAKRRAEVAPGVGRETDMFVITREGTSPVHNVLTKELEKDYENAERRRQKRVVRRAAHLELIASREIVLAETVSISSQPSSDDQKKT
jgi:hypothetical protein